MRLTAVASFQLRDLNALNVVWISVLASSGLQQGHQVRTLSRDFLLFIGRRDGAPVELSAQVNPTIQWPSPVIDAS